MSASSKKQLRKEQNAAALTEKQLQEKKEAKKLKLQSIAFITVIVLVLGIALGVVVNNAVNNSGILQKGTAVTIGKHNLSAAELNYFYIDYISETYAYWQQTYGDYTDMYLTMLYGLSTSAPLDTQYYDTDKIVTWAEFFANQAATDAAATYAMYDHAVAEGYTLSEASRKSIDSNIATFELYATLGGYASLDAYLDVVYGPGSSVESYRKYMEMTQLVQDYYTEYGESLAYDDAALRAYEAEHYNEFSSYDYAYFYVDADDFLTGGTTDENNNVTYSDEEIAASVAAAKAAAEELVASGATDGVLLNKAIAQLEAYAEDTSAVCTEQTGVLYSNLSTTFAEWLSASERKAGDIGMVADESTTTDEDGKETTTVYGYYVLVLKGLDENLQNLVNVRHILVSFEGGTTDSTTGTVTYSDAEKQTALDKANAVLDTYNAGERTEEAFAALVAENSDDEGSVANGGLYEDVYPGQMVPNFNNWCFDEARKAGDVEIVETEYGYHIMYFVSTSETTFRDYMIDNTLRAADVDEWYNGIVESVECENLKIKHLNLDYIINPNAAY